MAGLGVPQLLLVLTMIICLAESEPSAALPQCSYTVRAIRFGFQFKMTIFPTGSYMIIIGEEGSPTTEKILSISSSNKNPTHEIQHLKPCMEYEHNVTLLDINGTEILCSGSGGKAKTLNLNEQDITSTPCIPGYVCYQSGWNISSSLSAPNQVRAEKFVDGTFGFELAEEDICSNFTINFNQDNCNNSSFNLTHYISADYINPNKMNQTEHNRLPAEIETKLPPNCKNLSIEFTCSESGKVGDSIQLSNLEPFTDYICTGLIKNNNVSVNKTTPAFQFNIDCDLTIRFISHYTTQTDVTLWFETTSENCGTILPTLKKLSYDCGCRKPDGNIWHSGKAERESSGGICKTDGLKAYTNYTFVAFAMYNNRSVSKETPLKWETKAGVPDKVQQLKVRVVKHNVIRVTCSPPVGGFKGPKKAYIVRVGDREVEQTDECDFEIEDLSYLTSYTVEVVAFNGNHESEAETAKVSTRYDDKALNGSLIFILIILIIVLIALRLAVFMKKRRKSKNYAKRKVMPTKQRPTDEDAMELKSKASFTIYA